MLNIWNFKLRKQSQKFKTKLQNRNERNAYINETKLRDIKKILSRSKIKLPKL